MILPEDVAAQQGVPLYKMKKQPDNMCTTEHIFSKVKAARNRKHNRPITTICCRKCNMERGLRDLKQRELFMKKLKNLSRLPIPTTDRECANTLFHALEKFIPLGDYIRTIAAVALLILSINLHAQTPYFIMRPYVYNLPDTTVRVQAVSLKNTWFNSKLSIPLRDDGLLKDNVIFSARVLYTPLYGDDYAFPIVGTFAPGNTNIYAGESGLNFGIYPYKVLYGREKTILVLHGGFGYKILLRENEHDPGREQWKALAGIEWLHYQTKESEPVSISLTANVWQGKWGGEITGIIPVGPSLGLLAEYTQRINQLGILRVGLILGEL